MNCEKQQTQPVLLNEITSDSMENNKPKHRNENPVMHKKSKFFSLIAFMIQ